MASKKPGILKRIVIMALFSLLILSFAAWGIQDIFLNLGANNSVATVGEMEVTQSEFSSNLSRETNAISQQVGRALDFQEAQQIGLVSRVISRLVGQTLFRVQSEEMGLMVTEETLKKEILDIPAFRNEVGVFDANRFQNTLYQAGMSESQFLSDLAKDIEREQISNAVTGSVSVSKQLAEQLYTYNAERRVVDFIEIPYARFEGLAGPTDEEMSAYYDEQKNNFLAPEYKSVSYLHLDPKEAAKTVSVTQEQIEEEFAAQKDGLSTPERRKLSQIVIDKQEQAKAAHDQLVAGATFSDVAKEYTGSDAIDLGNMSRNDLLPELASGVFYLTAPGVTEPIQSPLGWHLVSVEEISQASEAKLEDVLPQITESAALRVATDELISLANQLDDELAGGATLAESAAKLGQTIKNYVAIDAQGLGKDGTPLEGLSGNEKFLEILGLTAAGNDSLLTELGDGGYFILKVENVTPAAPRALEEIRTELTDRLLEDRRKAEAEAVAKKLVEEVQNGTALQAVTDEAAELITFAIEINRSSSNIGNALAPGLVQDIYKAKQGDVLSGEGDGGYLVVTVTGILRPNLSLDSEQVKLLQDQLEGSYRNDIYAQYIKALETDYNVQINQGAINQIINPYGTTAN
ncbi:SurA N-terminal domain-containing protein [Kiloniella laminariae]|uniref:SurA N-terminal domain-containing protein n=1 Tax=Kiloniella laminariae TaxID=454162 RepID=UPI000372A7C6|nr:SurA N-terminal domain-containing protein [Kiloniella laminariae]